MELITELERANDLIRLHLDGVQWNKEDAERVYAKNDEGAINHIIYDKLDIIDWYRSDLSFYFGKCYENEKGIAAQNKYHQSELYHTIL